MNRYIITFYFLLIPIAGFAKNIPYVYLGTGLGLNTNLSQIRIDTNCTYGKIRCISSICLDAKIGLPLYKTLNVFINNKCDAMLPYSNAIIHDAIGFEAAYNPLNNLIFTFSSGRSYWLYPFNSYFNSAYAGKGFFVSFGVERQIFRHFIAKIEYLFSGNQFTEHTIGSSTMGNTASGIYYAQTYISNYVRFIIFYDLLK